ncbi:MAG: hypothetical protein ACREAN_07590, partial [Nitrosopumilaceae archaeon]
MNGRWREYFMLYSKSKAYSEAVREAENTIEKNLDSASYVACSGGKDSLTLLHLCQLRRPDVLIFYWDHGKALLPRKVSEEIESCIRLCAPRGQLLVHAFKGGFYEKARTNYSAWYKAFYATIEGMK